MRTCKFLNIGAFPGNDCDESRIVMTVHDLWQRGWDSDKATHEFVDLNTGRDFLRERPKADVVILHWIYDDPFPVAGPSLFRISPLHCLEAWRESLRQTGAGWIYVYGGEGEVSAAKLGNLPGYTLDHVRVGAVQSDKAVYVSTAIQNERTIT